jgi:hypothetical protein
MVVRPDRLLASWVAVAMWQFQLRRSLAKHLAKHLARLRKV